jgi:hypothetical protein
MMGGIRKPTTAQPAQVVTVPKVRQSAGAATVKKGKKNALPGRRTQPGEYHVPDENQGV